MSATGLITQAWKFTLNTTFADAHYVNARLPCNDFNGSGVPNTIGPPKVIGAGISSICVTNASLGAPNWYVSLTSEYDVALPFGLNGFLRGLYTFTPRNQLTLQSVNQDPRNIVNFYAGIDGPTGRWEASLFVKNLFNTVGTTNLFGEQYVTGYLLPNTTNTVNYDSGYASSLILRPRELGATITYHF